MKKIYLLLAAAVAALSSCVEENVLVPEENQNKVTIKAVSGETKTALDGISVVWEEKDVIKVFLYDGENTLSADFGAESVDGSSASFVGSFSGLEFDFADLESAYAVLPASAYDPETGKITVTLPENQVDGITSDMFLSSAELDLIDLEDGVAEAQFTSALTLLNVVVPEGVKSVSLTATGDYGKLVGTAEFGVDEFGTLERKTFASTIATVYLANEDGTALTACTYPMHVLPGEPKNLKLEMKDMDGEAYYKTVAWETFEAGKYYTVDLTKIFNLEVPETLDVSALGGSFTWSAVGVDTEFTVSENADWLTCEVVDTKGYGVAYVNLNVERNSTGLERTAEVVVTWGENNSRTLVVTQPTLFMDFVYVEETNEIEFEETFGVYNSEKDAKDKANVESTISKNTFRIELNTADPTKGAYKVTNIFKSASYTHNGQPVTNKGGEFFANYEDGVLTLYRASGVLSYGFTSDIKLAYDSANKTFSQVDDAIYAYSYSAYRAKYIGGYSAAVKVETPETPETPGESEDPYVGTWDITYEDGGSAGVSWLEKEGTMTIELKGDVYEITDFAGIAVGWQLSQTDNVFSYNAMGTTLTLTYDEEKAQFTTATDVVINYYGSPMFCFRNLVATKPGAEANPLESLNGSSWDQVYVHNQSMMEHMLSSTMTISIAGNQVTLSDFFVTGTTAVGTLSGSTITIPSGTTIKNAGTLDSDAILTISQDGETITSTGFSCGSGWWVVSEYTATKQ